MSFKRDGDDQSQLNLLKKRRVSDLLADGVPEDEAFLMSSGRYACTVCHYRPVFDTIAMLLVHRKGKKHLNNIKSYYAKKQDLMREVEKRKQLLYVESPGKKVALKEAEDAAPLLTKTRRATHHALLKAAPYKGYKGPATKQECNSFSGKSFSDTARSLFQRTGRNSLHQGQHDLCSGLTDVTQLDRLPGNRSASPNYQSEPRNGASCSSTTQDRSEISDTGDNLSQCQRGGENNVDKLCSPKLQSGDTPLTVEEKRHPAPFQLKPYVPKHRRNKDFVDTGGGKQNSPNIRVSSKVDLTRTKGLSTFKQNLDFTEEQSRLESDVAKRDAVDHSSTLSSGAVLLPCRDVKNQSRKSKKPTSSCQKFNSISGDLKKIEKEKYLKLTSSGWKTDWKGGWVQDQDVEFDSDEEVPAKNTCLAEWTEEIPS